MALNFNSNTEKMYSIVIDSHEFKLNESDTQKVIDLIQSLGGKSTIKRGVEQPKSFTKKSTKKDFDPSGITDDQASRYDVEINLTVKDGNTVQLDSFIKRDVYKLLDAQAQALGGKYNKDAKAWIFGTKKAATQFSKIKKISGKDRVAIWKSYKAS